MGNGGVLSLRTWTADFIAKRKVLLCITVIYSQSIRAYTSTEDVSYPFSSAKCSLRRIANDRPIPCCNTRRNQCDRALKCHDVHIVLHTHTTRVSVATSFQWSHETVLGPMVLGNLTFHSTTELRLATFTPCDQCC